MDKATAVIRKVGDKYCVFSESGKNLGCSKTREGAEKRLKQVEFFKHRGSSNMNYENAFDNFTKALRDDIDPTEIGKAPDGSPREIEVESETLTVADKLRDGSIASRPSSRLLDNKDHFPVCTPTQAQSSMSRVLRLTEAPSWYNGAVADLCQEVYDGIIALHPDIGLKVSIPIEQTIALSDGETSPTTSKTSIDDPNDVQKSLVPQVARPTLTSAQVAEALDNEEDRKVIAGRLMEMVDQQMDHLKTAKKVATRLLKSGIKAEEFDQMSTYVQEDILRELVSRGVNASAQESRRRILLDRLGRKDD